MAEKRHINLIKLCVGADSVEDLEAWIARRAALAGGEGGGHVHVTRMWPKRAQELLAGGSLYWVIRGLVQARQRILDLREAVGEDGIRRCAIVLDPELVRTAAVPRRPFQGWRYLEPQDAPPDLSGARAQEAEQLPAELARALAEMGLR